LVIVVNVSDEAFPVSSTYRIALRWNTLSNVCEMFSGRPKAARSCTAMDPAPKTKPVTTRSGITIRPPKADRQGRAGWRRPGIFRSKNRTTARKHVAATTGMTDQGRPRYGAIIAVIATTLTVRSGATATKAGFLRPSARTRTVPGKNNRSRHTTATGMTENQLI
jgi:hypothetical protein